MSSFINSAKHFNSVEEAVCNLAYNDQFYLPYSLKTICGKWYDSRKNTIEAIHEEIKAHFDTLRELQALCVTLQYKHHYPPGTLNAQIEVETEETKQKTEIEPLTIHGIFKALGCISYQIETEHLKELRQLTQKEEDALFFLDELQNSIAHYIVGNTPEYEEAKYSIE